jgi:hypothetical protein
MVVSFAAAISLARYEAARQAKSKNDCFQEKIASA